MASADASPIPVKNQAYRVSFPLLDADGDLVTGATGLDSEVSKDGGTFTDCASEATEIATASGMYYLDLTAAEMNADTVCVIVKTTSAGAKTTPMVLYPNKTGGLSVNVTSWAGTATATTNVALKNTLAKSTDITGFNDLSAAQVNTEADTALVDVGLTTTVTGRIDAATSTRATPAQVQAELVTYNAAKPGAAMTLTSAYDPAKTAATQTSVNTIDGRLDTEIPAIQAVTAKLDTALELDGAVYRYTTNALEQAPVGGGGGGDASQATLLAVKAKTDNLPTDPADASDIAASFTTVNTNLATLSGYVDTEVAAIKAKTDNLPVDPADASDIAASFVTTNGKIDAVAAKTNNLPADPADASDIAASFTTVNTKLDTVNAAVDTEIPAIKAKTDQLTFTAGKVDANVADVTLDVGDLNSIADAILKRDFTAISGEAAYSLLNAARMLRNSWNTTGGTLTVKKEDGSTTAWTRTLAVDPTATPIIGAT
jgi:hypothetical protein